MGKRIGLVGCGRISRRQIEAIDATSGVEVAVVCDIDPERARHAGEKLGVSWTTDYKTIRGVDVVSVMTPSGYHPVHVSEIAETTDAPCVLCEKPLSLTLDAAADVYDRVEAAGKRLLPVYQNRYNPLVQLLRKLILDGSLGTIHQFNVNIFWNRNDEYFQIDWHGTRELDGGVLYTQASHYVDMLLYLFGPVQGAKGIGGHLRGLPVQDTVSAVIQHERGAVGSLNCTVSTFRKNYQTEFTIIGSTGTVRIEGTNLNTISFWDVQGIEKPKMDFSLDHIYGKGHDTLYGYIAQENWDKFPSRDEVLAGIELMERISF